MAKEAIVTSCLEAERQRKCLHLEETPANSAHSDSHEHLPIIIQEGTPPSRKKNFWGLRTIDSDSDDDYDDGFEVDVRRRGSNVSLSRYRSCPQLPAECDRKPESYEQTTDDSLAVYSPPDEHITPVLHSASPLIRRRLHLDINGFTPSETPTPPSTPKSRRSLYSQKDSPSTPGHGLSPVSTPRLWRRALNVPPSSLSRTSSADSNGDSHKRGFHDIQDLRPAIRVPLNEETLHVFEQFTDTPEFQTQTGTKTGRERAQVKIHEHAHHNQTDDTHGKCERWLQSLSIATPDRIKSRSHIQLPPI